MPRYRQPHTLTEAIYRKEWARVDTLLELGADPNEPRARFRTDRGIPTLPLTEAVQQENKEAIDKLLRAGADPEGKPGHYSPISKAITRKRLDLVQRLAGAGADVNRYRAFGGLYTSYLEEACSVGSAPIVAWLIDQGLDPNTDRNGFTVVHTCLLNGIGDRQKANLRVLRDKGADLLAAAIDDEGQATYHPVSYAAAFGDPEILEWFLQAGADANLVRDHAIQGAGGTDGQGLPLLGGVILGKGQEKDGMIRALVAHGARLDESIDFNTHTMGSVSHLSCQREEVHVQHAPERVLGGTYLTLAAAWSGVGAARELLAQGMDPNARSENGYTPLLAYSKHGWRGQRVDALEKLRTLLEAGADPNVPDAEGETVLHHFAGGGLMLDRTSNEQQAGWLHASIDLLLQHGADPHIRNHKGQTPVDLSWNGKVDNPIYAKLLAAAQREDLQKQTPGAPGVRPRARF